MSQQTNETPNLPMTDAQSIAWFDNQIKLARKQTELAKLRCEYYQFEALRLLAIHQIGQLRTPKPEPVKEEGEDSSDPSSETLSLQTTAE